MRIYYADIMAYYNNLKALFELLLCTMFDVYNFKRAENIVEHNIRPMRTHYDLMDA